MGHCAFFPASPRAMLFDNQIPCPFHPSDTVRHLVGHSLNMCPKSPKIGRRTLSDTLPDITSTCVRKVRKLAVGHRVGVMLKTCPIFPQRVSEIWQSDNPGHIVGLYLKHCPKSPKIGGRPIPDTVSELCSKGVRTVRNRYENVILWLAGHNRTRCRTLPQALSDLSEKKSDTGVGFTLERCPNLPQGVSGNSVGQLTRCGIICRPGLPLSRS